MQPTIGRVVLYTLTQDDAEFINGRRADRAAREGIHVSACGNHAEAGQVFAADVVRVWSTHLVPQCNLQVKLDGPDGLWATSRVEGAEPGTWAWPPRV